MESAHGKCSGDPEKHVIAVQSSRQSLPILLCHIASCSTAVPASHNALHIHAQVPCMLAGVAGVTV